MQICANKEKMGGHVSRAVAGGESEPQVMRVVAKRGAAQTVVVGARNL